VRTAKAFHERLPLTGLVLTRADGDGRGGAALSMRAVTGLPIKFLGVSEKIDGLDAFDARRSPAASWARATSWPWWRRPPRNRPGQGRGHGQALAKGQFDLDMMAEQLAQMKKMGGMEGLMGLLPGVQKIKKQIAEANISDKMVDRQAAIISSMTKEERKKPDILAASRKRRIAAGSGVDVAEVNRLLKQHRQMADAFKMMSKGGGRGFAQMAQMLGGGGGGGGMDRLKNLGGGKMPMPSQAEIEEMAAKLQQGGGPKLPGLGGSAGLQPLQEIDQINQGPMKC
jgi:signal recognition particle subunit SRP54